jgi:hypothetical protein
VIIYGHNVLEIGSNIGYLIKTYRKFNKVFYIVNPNIRKCIVGTCNIPPAKI